MKCPPPPAVGARLYGPSRSEGARKRGPFASLYHVRAVVDHEEHPTWGHLYYVVLRRYSARRGWSYTIENQFAFTPLSSGRAQYATTSEPWEVPR